MRTKLFGAPAILAALGWAPLAAASLLFASMSPAPADTFENFVIQNSSNPSAPGGTFYGGGTYSGSFSLDESLIPANPDARFNLQTFDVSFTIPFNNLHEDISSANGGTAVFSTFTLQNIQQSAVDLAIDTIEFNGLYGSSLFLQLVEPANVFQGGLVTYASASSGINGSQRLWCYRLGPCPRSRGCARVRAPFPSPPRSRSSASACLASAGSVVATQSRPPDFDPA